MGGADSAPRRRAKHEVRIPISLAKAKERKGMLPASDACLGVHLLYASLWVHLLGGAMRIPPLRSEVLGGGTLFLSPLISVGREGLHSLEEAAF